MWIKPPGPVASGLRIGLFGGSFNPAHEGHLYASLTALKRLKLDYVWWLVSPGNPLKSAAGMAPFGTRLAQAARMARHPRLIVTGIEQALATRYTVDTITALRRRFPQVHFIWLMGSDNLADFSRWRRWPHIAGTIPIAVIQRPGSLLASLNAAPTRRFGRSWSLETWRPPQILLLDGARSDESATRLRQGAGAH